MVNPLKEESTKKTQELENFLKDELIDKSQVQIPSGYRLVKKYALKPPFSYANILYDDEKSSYLYSVDEVKLNHEEIGIFENLYHLIEQSLESTDTVEENPNFDEQLDTVLKEHEKIFAGVSAVSMEKMKYYLRRDIAGFGLIDPLMHDINIEDVSCSGTDKSIYVWHRNYDSIPTNIIFRSEEKLNSFVSRIVFRAGKNISIAFPISDPALQGNHRISVLYQKEITPKGTSFTIRKRKNPIQWIMMISW